MAYEGMDPDEYRQELKDMGASDKDADAAVKDLIEKKI